MNKIALFDGTSLLLSVIVIAGIKHLPTKLPGKGGGQQQRPGKEEPLVGKEAGRNQRPPSMLEPVLGGVHSPSAVAPPG